LRLYHGSISHAPVQVALLRLYLRLCSAISPIKALLRLYHGSISHAPVQVALLRLYLRLYSAISPIKALLRLYHGSISHAPVQVASGIEPASGSLRVPGGAIKALLRLY
jgi:hypothetical protein